MLTSFSTVCHVIAIDYRGFGDSTPTIPTEQTLALDALAAYNWIVDQGVEKHKIVLVGHSLGIQLP